MSFFRLPFSKVPNASMRRIFLLIATIGALIGLVGVLGISYRNTRDSSIDRLSAKANLWSEIMNDTLVDAEQRLTDAAERAHNQPPPVAQGILRQLIFEKPLFREAGMVVQNKLVCTSYQLFDEPVPVIPEHGILSDPGKLHIVRPTQTLIGDSSLIINYNPGGDTYFNVLLSPESLSDLVRYVDREPGVAVFIMRGDGALLVHSKNFAKIAPPPPHLPPPGLSKSSSDLFYTQKVGHYDVYAVAVMPSHIFWQRWLDRFPLFGFLGFVLSVLCFTAAWRVNIRYRSLEAELREAARFGQIEPYFQPIVNLTTKRCMGAETLMRWRHPSRGLIPPLSFIPESERTGQITALTLAMIKVIAENFVTHLQDNPHFYLSVNLSAQTLNDTTFFSECKKLLRDKMPLERLRFEITESASLNKEAVGRLQEFKSHGIHLAIDDFGTGYSNLRYLRDYPFDLLKIDKAFVDGITAENESSGLVDHVIAIGKSCELSLIAEGIEHDYQAEYLERAGVKCGQGYFFGRPMPSSEFFPWLEKQGTEPAQPLDTRIL